MKIPAIIFISILFFSCKKSEYLDAKPDEKLIIPRTLKDFQAILDNDRIMNGTSAIGLVPTFTEAGSDNYFLTDNYLSSNDLVLTQFYTWNLDDSWGERFFEWNAPYQSIFYANVVLDGIKKLNVTPAEIPDYNNIKGSALFYRSFLFYNVAQVFAPPYDNSAATSWGIPLRLTSDINEVVVRATLQQTYDRVIGDLKEALPLLPDFPLYFTRPSKWAAYGMLARAYQTMNNYDSAFEYANKCLQLKGNLIDYNTLTITTTNYPLARFNPEVIFHAILIKLNFFLLSNSDARIDTLLYNSYDAKDKRRDAFYKTSTNGKAFRGSYDGSDSKFAGLATNEIYLIRAESYARKGDKTSAMKDLNDLLRTRWQKVSGVTTYVDQVAVDANDALAKILVERRKELVMRGLRWTDLRRLNKEGANITIARKVNGQLIMLPPNDLKYTFLIPSNVLGFHSDMPQNPR